MPCQMTPTIHAPSMPARPKTIASIGVTMRLASTRGTTRYCTGETPIVVIASICSVTRMLPSSLAIVLPARAVRTTDASTGASSRASASATTPPTMFSAENCRNPTIVLTVNAMPVKTPTRATMNVEPAPMKSSAPRSCTRRNGGRIAHANVCAPSVTVPPMSSRMSRSGLNPVARMSVALVSSSSRSWFALDHRVSHSWLAVEARDAARDRGEHLPRDGADRVRDLVRRDLRPFRAGPLARRARRPRRGAARRGRRSRRSSSCPSTPRRRWARACRGRARGRRS